MLRVKKYLTITAIITLLSLATSAGASEKSTELFKDGRGYRAERTHEFKAEINGKLKLTRIVGDVTVESWNENKVEIIENIRINSYTREEAERVLEDYTLRTETRGDVIVATGPSNYRGYVNFSYRVMLPKKFSAEVSTAGGDLELSKLTGDFELKTSGGDIEITECEGTIEAVTSGGDLELNKIKGTLYASTSGGDVTCHDCGDDLELKTSGGDLDLKRLKGSVFAKTSGGDIEVVEVEGVCNIETSGGEIYLHKISSKRTIEASTSGGDIDIDKITGNLDVRTSGGDITAKYIEGGLEASTSGGDIEIREITEYLEVSTSGGDVEIEGAGGYVEASTSGGDVTVSIAEYFTKKDQHVTMKSSGGDLEIYLPADFNGHIEARISVYAADLDEYEIYSDFPLDIRNNVGDRKKKKSYKRWSMDGEIIGTGDINSGGDPIILETTNGNIHIRKK